MARNKKKAPEVTEQDILNKANSKSEEEYTGIPEPAKGKKSLKDFFTTPEAAARKANDTALRASDLASEKALDRIEREEKQKFTPKKNVEKWKEDVAREKQEFEDYVNKEEGAESVFAKGDELRDQTEKQNATVLESQVNAPSRAFAETMANNLSPEFVDANNAKDFNKEEKAETWMDRIRNGIATDADIEDAYTAYKKGEYSPGPETLKEFEKLEAPAKAEKQDVTEDAVNNREAATQEESTVDPDFYQKYVDQYYGPQNGADYLKSLWSQGAGGKAAAIGNVLGNLMGAVGKGALGQDYETDWQKYKDNYIQAQAERNQRAFNDNMDIVKQIRQNDVVRNELSKTMEKMKELGKITPQEFEAIKKGMAATGKSSQVDYYLASILGSLASDKDFTEALKGMGEEGMKLLSGIAGFAGNAVGGINRFFGGGR